MDLKWPELPTRTEAEGGGGGPAAAAAAAGAGGPSSHCGGDRTVLLETPRASSGEAAVASLTLWRVQSDTTAISLGGGESELDFSFRMCSLYVTPTPTGKHCTVEAGEMYVGSVLRPWVLRDLEMASKFPNSCEIESLVGHSRVTPSLKIELDLPDRSGVVENGRVIITLKRMQGGGRVDEVSALAAGMEGFVEEVAAEVALGREEVEGTEGAAVFYLLVEDCLVEGSTLDAAGLLNPPDPSIECRDVRAAITFTGEAALPSLPPNASTRTVKVHIAETALWLLDGGGSKLDQELVLPSQSSTSAGGLLKEVGFAQIAAAKGVTVMVTTPVAQDAHLRARIALDVHHLQVGLCADSLASVSSLTTWLSSSLQLQPPASPATTSDPLVSSREECEEAPPPDRAGPRLCVIEDFDDSGIPSPVTAMEPLSAVEEEEVSVWGREECGDGGGLEREGTTPLPLSSSLRRETLDCYGGVETSATWFAPMDGATIIGDHFAGTGGALRSSPSSGVTTPGSQRTVLEGLEVRVTASVIELKLFEGKDWSERPSKIPIMSTSNQIRISTRAKRATICTKLEEVLLRYDSSPGGHNREGTQIAHSRLEISILPLRLTLDQDTVHWMDTFADTVNMYVYAAMDMDAELFEEGGVEGIVVGGRMDDVGIGKSIT
ncbi:hypothetical protein Pmar_PMAR011833 [Perkinsus marinus ATCC 50983]|uniref:Uncharacterized protein n=1 Tax=Perkinsus marinus (strain ATCC 50983 / TXsc) TaxID=423536 RepID=C5LBG3_PERM5|nr:hypothetical protein Pmar_PMAR011833 [Perkinsus marinus ATCC 50983]EER05784.1 hypothetical protein Pmar_PMAR011833 [Perkinsus marinus ATCC 50983]|eukprot:XP_002773968.1 hypothetical protein Pmar_PMAR011833 [Perkinsus marinus ATCC 50983]